MRVPLLLACQCVDLLEFRTLALSLLFIATSDHAVFVLINVGFHCSKVRSQPLTEVLFSRGESMENTLRVWCKGKKIGKILIHRDGYNGKQLIYEKLPNDISERQVLLLDPVLATGNSANRAIQLLIEKGFPESQFTFLNLISAPEGIQCVCKRFPSLKIVTSEIDVA
ncbi:hypothetical protein WN943_010560 [Citrus x changshan-huyou]